jgi:hypothetical protein
MTRSFADIGAAQTAGRDVGAVQSPSAPTVTGCAPGQGARPGGTLVVLAGTGFLAGATVTIGGVAASAVSVDSSTAISCRTGGHPGGRADVTVTNWDGQSGTLAGGYVYGVPVPVLVAGARLRGRRRIL